MAINKLETVYRYLDGSIGTAWKPEGVKLGDQWATMCEGRVIGVYMRDYRAMSDVYTYATFASVWNGTCIEEVLVNANFECDCSCGNAQVDATTEVLASVAAFKAEAEAKELARVAALRERAAEEARKRPDKGRTVKVVRGRKVPIGTVGVVFWAGIDGYGTQKIGIATSDRKDASGRYIDAVFTAAKNCEAIVS